MIQKGSVLVFVLMLSLVGVYAFGASSPYWDENPLILGPGEGEDVTLVLQNMVGRGDVTLRAELINGSDIAVITDENKDYYVPLGRDDIKLNIRVDVPDTYELGSQREVTVIFRQIAESEGGFLEMTGVFTKSFPVKVLVPEPEQSSGVESFEFLNTNLLWLILAAIIIIIVVIIVKKHNK